MVLSPVALPRPAPVYAAVIECGVELPSVALGAGGEGEVVATGGLVTFRRVARRWVEERAVGDGGAVLT